MVASGITFLACGLTTPRNAANLELAIGILGVVFLNAAIGFAREHSAERTAEALQAMVASSARVMRAGALTGESRSTPRIAEAVDPEMALHEARTRVFMGTSVVNGSGRALVYATGLSTELVTSS